MLELRWGNKEREWPILQRYQRGLSSSLGFALYLYVLGLSVRDLQQACYFLLGAVISRSAINPITLQVQARLDHQRLAPITEPPRACSSMGCGSRFNIGSMKSKKSARGINAKCGRRKSVSS